MKPTNMATKRRSVSTLDNAIVAELEAGTRETRDLVELLAIDLAKLFHQQVSEAESAHLAISRAKGTTAKLRAAGEWIADQLADSHWTSLIAHPSDTVRGFAAFAIPHRSPELGPALQAARPFAADPHFAVREWAWLAVRPLVAQDVPLAIELLRPWVHDPDPNIRRFAVEITRPRGVWCAHLPDLKEHPEMALSLLTPLVAEPKRYVQDSVANWLNDASKTQPEFVLELTDRWLAQDPSPHTLRMVRRARRSLKLTT